MALKAIVGPVLRDIERVGIGGKEVVIASAFYSHGPLKQLTVEADRLALLVRLNLSSILEWGRGAIAPDALLSFAKRHKAQGTNVAIRISASAHAKVYLGSDAVLIGSSNLTSRGLAGTGHEVLWRDSTPAARAKMHAALNSYAGGLQAISLDELEAYVDANLAKARALAKNARKPETDETRVPRQPQRARIKRLGDYADFKTWLAKQPQPAAAEILARANGKGQLSGHIYANFYGLRQFLIARPSLMKSFKAVSPDTYKLSADPVTEAEMADFVTNEANDEDQFTLNIWKTYLPIECGGRAGKHGGTIGNLKRMLPLVARYLTARIK